MPQCDYNVRQSEYHPDNQCTTFFLRDCPEIKVVHEALGFRSNFIGLIESIRRRSISYVEDLTIEERGKAA